MNLTWAFVRNVGTCRLDDKGETQMGNPHKSESTEVRHRDGTIHSSEEVAVMAMERRGCVIQQELRVNRKGGTFGEGKVV